MKGIFFMRKRVKTIRLASVLGGMAAAVLCLSASALANEFERFKECPTKTTGAAHCLYAETGSGEIVLGKKTTKIVNKVILQGAYSEANEETNLAKFYGASNGETLTKAAQEVPGGLLGIVPPEKSPPLVKLLTEFFFNNSLTKVYATLELAKPATEIEISSFNLLLGEGLALKLPVKVHLENPFLGSSCYVGSSSSPIIWNLTTGTTNPPKPNGPITGKPGFIEVKENEELIKITEDSMVDNAWSTPSASGCGGILSFLVDPVINLMIGLPSTAGNNSAVLNNTIYSATVGSVNSH
jgi:hypothetical protein